jgi:hypothetical protein
MRAKWLWVVASAGAALGCGQGHAIFNVDVYSFIKGTGKDTIPYFIPPGTANASSTPQRIDLPGAGSSLVDSVLVGGRMDLENQAGAGTIGLQLFLAADSVGTFNSTALALTVPDASVSGTATTPDTIVGRFNAAVIQLFTGSQVWIRLQATGTNPGLILLQGEGVLKSLRLTVVINDKLF